MRLRPTSRRIRAPGGVFGRRSRRAGRNSGGPRPSTTVPISRSGCRSPARFAIRLFFNIVKNFTGNVPGEGGLVTFADSGWLLSITLPQQPHFIGQPEDIDVFWGYGLSIDNPGDFVKKPMGACTGRELLTEVLGHLGAQDQASAVLDNAIVLPRMMPYVMSEFLTRSPGDRPHVIPKGWWNLAFAGQFCELADDTVFTVEYSVRSAQAAVYSLLQLDRAPHAVYKGHHNPMVLYRAFMSLQS